MSAHHPSARTALLWLLLLTTFILLAAGATPQARAAAPPIRTRLRRPLTFEPNRGQAEASAEFIARTSDGIFLLSRTGIATGTPAHDRLRFAGQPLLVWDGALPGPNLEGALPLRGRAHYYEGRDPNAWITNVPFFEAVRCESLYPQVDVVYYANRNRLEYDLIVAPGGDPNQIRMRIDPPTRVAVRSDGGLELTRGRTRLVQHRPRIYQRTSRGTRPVAGRYRMANGSGVTRGTRYLSLEVGTYDRSEPLVIDPTLVYATYQGSSQFDVIRAVGSPTAPSGNRLIYTAGSRGNVGVLSGYNLSQEGPNSLSFESFLVGVFNALALDEANDLYAAGRTDSSSLPVVQEIFSDRPGPDAFVGRFRPNGQLRGFLTYLGGAGTDEATALYVDTDDSIYVAGTTDSDDFPVTGNGFRNAKRGGKDGFVCRILQPGHQYNYATCFGGNGDDAIRDMDGGVNSQSETALFFTGTTTSTRFFPIESDSNAGDPPFQRNKDAGTDAFAFHLARRAGTSNFELRWSTYVGGSATDVANSIVSPDNTNVFLCGTTNSPDFPHPSSPAIRGTTDAFIIQITSGGSRVPQGRFLGGTGIENARSIRRILGGLLLTGSTTSLNFPLLGPLFPFGQFLNANNEDTTHTDAFVTLLSDTLEIRFSTLLGGSDNDTGLAVGRDSFGDAVVAGSTLSTNFPVQPGAAQETLGGDGDGFLALIDRDPPVSSGAGLGGYWNPIRQGTFGERAPISRIQGVFTVQSQGADPARATVVAIYRSADTTLDAHDTQVHRLRVPPVPVGGTQDVPFHLVLRGRVSGQHLIGVVDFTNVINEPNEGNNVVVSPPLR